MERAHRKYSPSQADRNALCAGSARLVARVPERDRGEYALEGQDAHDVFEAAIKHGVRDARKAHTEHSAAFLQDVDDGKNMFYAAVQQAIDYVFAIIDEHPDAVVLTEQYVDPPCPSAPGEAGGYVDVFVYVPSTREAYIIDYKHGIGVQKRAADNRQTKQYGCGALFQEDPLVELSEVDKVHMVILQPRSITMEGEETTHTLTPFELYQYLDDIDDIAARCEDDNAALVPGEVQCQFCDARAICPARRSANMEAITGTQNVADLQKGLPDISGLDVQRLGRIRYHANDIRRWLNDVDKHCFELATKGIPVPGAKLVKSAPKRKYYASEKETAKNIAAMVAAYDHTEAINALDSLLKAHPVLETLYRINLIPLTHAEKLVREAYKQRVGRGKKKKAAEQAAQAFAFLTVKDYSGSVTLVGLDDPRPSVAAGPDAFDQVRGVLPPPKGQT